MNIPFFSGKKKESIILKKKPKVIIYSTKTCPWCAKTKEFLHENKVKYTEKDVGSNKKFANEMIKKSGQYGVPVVDINGEIIVGCNEDKLRENLGI